MVECKDSNCPFHAGLRVRGMVFEGLVVSHKQKKSAVIQRDYSRKVPKYERLEKRRSRLQVHVPECLTVKEGQHVKVGECRKLSKTKSHVVLEVLKK
jgi:small subunit ribosomal protein S17